MSSSHVVLVHGGVHASWCWDRVRPGLEALGINSTAVDLPGRGASLDRLVDPEESAKVVHEAIVAAGGPVVLCGHSAAGTVITAAAVMSDRVAHLVYLAAFMPDADESVVPLSQELATRLAPHLSVDETSMGFASREGAAEVLYHDCDEADVAWAVERLVREPFPGPEAVVRASAPSGLAPWRTVPTTFVVCAEDRAFPPALQRDLAKKSGAVVEWPTSHSPFLSRPDLVVDLLAGLAVGKA